MKIWARFLSKIISIIFVVVLATPCIAETNVPLPTGDVGEYGTWLTEHNLGKINDSLSHDLGQIKDSFEMRQGAPGYVPVEAKLGLVFMNALSEMGYILDKSLVRFMIMFILIGYAFWILLEVYNMIMSSSNVRKFAEDAVKNGAIIAVWLIVLDMGFSKLFMYVLGPVMAAGTTVADFILASITSAVHISLPDTCGAIREYAQAHTSANVLVDANMAADLMCLPTRMSGLFVSGIKVGWHWVVDGIGHSAMTVLMGFIFIVIFAINIWKFALMALGVIADLALALFMLPFTAIAETLGKFKLSKGGILSDIWTALFKNLLSTQTLESQIARFLSAIVYFVTLALIIAICAALMSFTLGEGISTQIPNMNDTNWMTTLVVGCMVLYLANQAQKWAENWGGKIDASLGQQFGNDLETLGKNAWKNRKPIYQGAKATVKTGANIAGATGRGIKRVWKKIF